jgi:uncharacterized membrane protein
LERYETSIEVDCPVRTVYNQWTQFEAFPRFMEGVEQVRQLDDTRLYWRATVGGKTKEWNAEITEQVPDQRIAWKSTSGAPNAGSVHFEPLGVDRTRVLLKLAYDPQGLTENLGDAFGVVSRRIDATLRDFKQFIERRGAARFTGAGKSARAAPPQRSRVLADRPPPEPPLADRAATKASVVASWASVAVSASRVPLGVRVRRLLSRDSAA